MAVNFRISIHRNGDNLHFKLHGDFDGTSAHELISAFSNNRAAAGKIFVHTSELKDMYPFGCAVFRNNLSRPNIGAVMVVFTGKRAADLAPTIPGRVMVV